MSDVHAWAKKNIGAIESLLETFRTGKPERDLRPAKQDASTLIRVSGEIESKLSTLAYVSKGKSSISDLKFLVLDGDTPDNAYFSPSPGLSGVGLGSTIGGLAGVGLAVTAVIKGAIAERKYSASVEANSGPLKQSMMANYGKLANLLRQLTMLASESEDTAKKLNNAGLNVPILNDTYRVIKTNQWLMFNT